ncbi:type VI secretion system protein TssR [Spirosoma taeanense]|uniref:Type VI secretion system protein TssR n=1 Tax=Spirosoma taeanense TaxID=2735870 RepID=A0A6M5YBX9_9BACT|nr:type VI secretion system protein TssR [Spirosoma taeanense]QJW91627.1 type VI secretion system protein TssR [Spirosoma taeanense]
MMNMLIIHRLLPLFRLLLMVGGFGASGSAWAQLPFFLRIARQPANLVPIAISGVPKGNVGVINESINSSLQPPGGLPWIVFSDRNNNNTFQSTNATTPFRKANFMDAFYVLKERKGYLKLIKYDPALPIGNKISRRVITNRKAVVYYGWAPKDHFLLTNFSSRSGEQNRPQIISAVLAKPELLTNPDRYFSNDSVRLFAGPGQQVSMKERMKLYELAYLYKLSETRRQALIGRASWFPTDSIKQVLMGWMPIELVQPIGQRLFLEADTVRFPYEPVPMYRSLATAQRQKKDSTIVNRYFPAVSWNRLGAKFPITNQLITRDSGRIVLTNVQIPLVERRRALVLNVLGKPIDPQTLDDVTERSNRFNLIYVIEGSSAMHPYWGELLNTIQFTVTQLAQDTTQTIDLRVGAVVYDGFRRQDTDRGYNRTTIVRGAVGSIPLTTNSTYLLNELRKDAPPSTPSAMNEAKGIRLGLIKALAMFADHPGENNILVLVGINGDLQSISSGNQIVNALKQTECRLLSFQVHAAPGDISNNFVIHSRELALQIASHSSDIKKNRLVRPDMVTLTNEFNLKLGDRNVYQLAYPERSMVPSWILFPRKNQVLPFRELYAATDSLFKQVAHESQAVLTALESTFDQLIPLSDRVNPRLSPVYASAGVALPADAVPLMPLAAYPYLMRAYTPLALKDGPRWKYTALLPIDEYDGVAQLLQQLSGDDIDPTSFADRQRLHRQCRRVMEAVGLSPDESITLDQVLVRLLDLPVTNPLLKRIVINQISSRTEVSDALLSQVLYLLRERRDYFQRIPTFRNSRFTSNERTYYWISEDLFR